MKFIVKRALDTDVAIATDSDRVLESIKSFVAPYPPARGEPTLRYVLDVAHGVVTRDLEVIATSFREDWFAPFVERDLYESVSARAAPSFVVHAGAVVRDGRAVLLVGASGAGKTTMCRALVARGATYVTDEIAAIDEQLRVRGVPRPFAIEGDYEGPVPGYEFVADDGTHVRARFQHLPSERVHRDAVELASVVHLRHAPSEPSGARALRSSEALIALWEQRLRVGVHELDVASTLVQRVAAFELVTREIEGACRDIDALLSRG